MCGHLWGNDDRLVLIFKHSIHTSVLPAKAAEYFRQHHISSSSLLFIISVRSLWPFVLCFLTNAVPHLLGRHDCAAPPSDIICLYLRGNACTVKFRFQRAALKTLLLLKTVIVLMRACFTDTHHSNLVCLWYCASWFRVKRGSGLGVKLIWWTTAQCESNWHVSQPLTSSCMFMRPSGPSKPHLIHIDTCKPIGLREAYVVNVSNACTALWVSPGTLSCLL